ncbi:MAG: DUF1844 domain-containing protein [Deltaproteobacteria bacterium]|nr:DUF1844 domain-containing protein [Deltaproteobacteria bacterium]
MSDDEKGFVIKDKRVFATGDEEGEQDEPITEAPPESKEQAEFELKPETQAQDDTAETTPLPEINFATFVFSLSSSALLHLGEMPDPTTNKTAVNLQLAKQTIDILAMLQAKTSGNLDEDEENLLKNLLYELRMKYVAL